MGINVLRPLEFPVSILLRSGQELLLCVSLSELPSTALW